MRLPWTARTRRLLFVVAVLLVLTLPLVSTLITRARVERSGVDVTATVVETSRNGDAYLVAFRLPEEIDPDQKTYSSRGRAGVVREGRGEQTKITVRVLEDRPTAHRVEGEITNKAPYVVMVVADASCWSSGCGGSGSGGAGRRCGCSRREDLEPAEHEGPEHADPDRRGPSTRPSGR